MPCADLFEGEANSCYRACSGADIGIEQDSD